MAQGSSEVEKSLERLWRQDISVFQYDCKHEFRDSLPCAQYGSISAQANPSAPGCSSTVARGLRLPPQASSSRS